MRTNQLRPGERYRMLAYYSDEADLPVGTEVQLLGSGGLPGCSPNVYIGFRGNAVVRVADLEAWRNGNGPEPPVYVVAAAALARIVEAEA